MIVKEPNRLKEPKKTCRVYKRRHSIIITTQNQPFDLELYGILKVFHPWKHFWLLVSLQLAELLLKFVMKAGEFFKRIYRKERRYRKNVKQRPMPLLSHQSLLDIHSSPPSWHLVNVSANKRWDHKKETGEKIKRGFLEIKDELHLLNANGFLFKDKR